MTAPSPDRLLSLIHGHWVAASIATASTYSFFTLIDSGMRSAPQIAKKAGISTRGTQAILDALASVGLVKVAKGLYVNTSESKTYLVKGGRSYLGDLSEALFFRGGVSHMWGELASVVKKGSHDGTISPGVRSLFKPLDYISYLIDAIRPMTSQAARLAAGRLRFSHWGPATILDVGGGSGVFSSIFLRANRFARAVQIDRPVMNRIARDYLGSLDLMDRFETVDGDFLDVDFKSLQFDIIICSNYIHLKSQRENIATLKKIKKLLRSGGRLILNDYFLDRNRKGHALVMLSSVNWLLLTLGGNSWCLPEVHKWLRNAGFRQTASKLTSMVTTLVFAG